MAIIAHVDHGKTTLVDSLLRQSGMIGAQGNVQERVMDNNELERERGITILAKNTSIVFNGTRINILDTPGHHDFGGEVERMLMMADGVVLLVDAAEGPLPQTRFVLNKALKLKLRPIVVINKIDRKDARCDEVLDEIYDLFMDLGGDDANIDFPILYTDGRKGIARRQLDDESMDLLPLFETLIDEIPAPADQTGEPFTMQVNNLGWDEYVGRLVIGRVNTGSVKEGQRIWVQNGGEKPLSGRVLKIFSSNGLERIEVDQAFSGDIVSVAGIDGIKIGDSFTETAETPALPRIAIDEPTMAMCFCTNTSPMAGKDGPYITSRNIKERLEKESRINVSIRVEDTKSTDVFRVVGRGELQLSILAETLRREGFEMALSRPEVITKEIDGVLHEPLERLFVDCLKEGMGAVSEMLGPRKAKMLDMVAFDSRVRLVYTIPTRGLIGLHSEILTETKGSAIINTHFEGWIPWQGAIPGRRTGALVADRSGKATPYSLFHLQPRGVLFIEGSTEVYEGMIIGETPSGRNIDVNPTKPKKLTNMRASGKDDNIILSRPKKLSLEACMEFINEDELIEVTPHFLRLRKKASLCDSATSRC